MITFIFIKDTQTGKTFQALREGQSPRYLVIEDGVEVEKRLGSKLGIGAWMKERRNDNGG